ncbi:hypothetical protein ASF17_05860 [Frigoribacterium sp. Leaf263]|uniref:TasA family protein n=1 Tax=Frigoribacterium sp. Leaf263 TaxID=1736313 RepID=UPI0006F7E686|nr:TasA family protein [Frigoribacterium sp. Leaf263]KQO82582.1 hypothetical protein ASF17_05860 [Frigoribacterium sp. Leaf263]
MSRPAAAARRHRAEPSRRAGGLRRLVRSTWSATGLVVVGLLALVATAGGTYALLGASATSNASVIASGSASVTVGSVSSLDVAKLGPGRSVSGTFVVRNTGTVPLQLRLTGTTPTSVDAAVVGELTAAVAVLRSGSSCAVSTAGASTRAASFDTGASWAVLPAGQSLTACLVLALDADAPATVQNTAASVGFVVAGTQVAP